VDKNEGLLKGIEAQARAKSEKIVADAQIRADKTIADALETSKHNVEVEAKAYKAKVATEQLKVEASLRSVTRKVQLEVMSRRYNSLVKSVKEKVLDTLKSKEGSDVLCSWITEAVLGLGLDEAKIAYCIDTPVTEKMLRRVEKNVKEKYNLSLALQLDSRRLFTPGVVATSLDGKISFNNQIDVRMRRFDKELKVAVQEGSCPTE
jgi:V/A-type H+-transporting ATPase subunit E